MAPKMQYWRLSAFPVQPTCSRGMATTGHGRSGGMQGTLAGTSCLCHSGSDGARMETGTKGSQVGCSKRF